MRSLLLCAAALLVNACSGPVSTPLETIRHTSDGAYAADISPDATLAVISTTNEGILVWDLETQTQRYQWQHSGEEVNVVANIHISLDKRYVVTADRDAFALWNLNSGDPVGFWRIDESSIRDVKVSDGGRGILVARGSGKVMFFEPDSGRRLEFLGHQEKVNSIDLSPNGFYALSGGNDYVAYLWDTRSGQVIHRFTHSSRVTKVALDDQGRYAFTADSKRDARIWDIQTGQVVSRLDYLQRQKIFSTAVFSGDGKYLLTGSPSRRINLWQVDDGEEVKEWKVAPREGSRPQSAVVYALGFLDDQRIVSESSSGLAEIWSVTQ